MSVYDDPRLTPLDEGDRAEQITFPQPGSRVKARILSIEPIQTQFGFAVRYGLLDLDTQSEVVMFSGPNGARDLWRKLRKERPEVGDDVEVTFVRSVPVGNGTFKEFDVKVSRQQEMPF
jgi:hypothetical protein